MHDVTADTLQGNGIYEASAYVYKRSSKKRRRPLFYEIYDESGYIGTSYLDTHTRDNRIYP